MVARKPESKAERSFWEAAFLKAEVSLLVRKGTSIDPRGLAHLCSEFANAAVYERRHRETRHGQQS